MPASSFLGIFLQFFGDKVFIADKLCNFA